MATTTNFGWETPDDTDLVKDGAAAIRTALGGVDTSFVDLKGGTTGQVLAKASGTDLDYTWTTPTTGMTNPMTTTGDTIYSSSGSTPARLGIGTTGQVLTVAAGVPSWANLTSTFAGCFLYQTSAQTINNGTETILLYGGENFDTNGFHSTATNTGRITIPAGKGGYYLFVYSVLQTTNGTTGARQIRIRKNGSSDFNVSRDTVSLNGEIWSSGSIILDGAASDYFEVAFTQTTGTTMTLDSGSNRNYFQCVYLGA